MKVTKKVALQMDPMDSLDVDGDSTLALGLEAMRRGYELYHYGPDELSLDRGRVVARMRPLQLRPEKEDYYTLGPPEVVELERMDVVLMRQDPPFDMGYITATYLLESIHPKTLVVNDPHHVRNCPEKLFINEFPSFIPPTLISRDKAQIENFRRHYEDIIIKPLYGNGGAGVFHVKPEDENLYSLLEMFFGTNREPIIVQQYLPAVRAGDKRIIFVDGEARGAINRIPADGEARSNLHVGGCAVASTLSTREQEICAAIGPVLRTRGLIFTGIDVIGGLMTEINVTSPTCLRELARFDGVHLERDIWDAIEARLTARDA